MPRPPPPAAALSISGRPMPDKSGVTAASSGTSRPGTTGTPASLAARRAASLLPNASWASGGGPIQISPASRTARAKAAFSDRNP